MWAALLSLLGGAIEGISTEDQLRKYIEALQNSKQELPPEVMAAQRILAEAKNKGIPNEQAIMESLWATMPKTLNEAKKVVQSPSQLLGMVAEMYSTTQDKLLNLQVKDEEMKIAANDKYAQFLYGVKAPMVKSIADANKNIDSQIKIADSQADWAIVNGILGGTGNAISAYGASEQSKSYNDYLKTMTDFWGSSNSSNTATLSTPALGLGANGTLASPSSKSGFEAFASLSNKLNSGNSVDFFKKNIAPDMNPVEFGGGMSNYLYSLYPDLEKVFMQ